MTTITTGVFFVRTKGCRASADAHGFSLVMHLLDKQGRLTPGDPKSPERVEPYMVKWSGEAARTFWADHGPLKPGAALRLELENPRSFVGQLGQPETHARVRRCDLLPARQGAQVPAPSPAAAGHVIDTPSCAPPGRLRQPTEATP